MQSLSRAARPVSLVLPLLLSPLALVGTGCSSQEVHKPVFPVQGKVLVAGKPAAKALVIFHPLNDPDPKAPRPNAETGADGTFTLSTYTAGDGAPAGDYAVTVLWPEGTELTGGDADSGPDRLGNRYSNPQTSGLRAQVHEGPNALPPFQLRK